MKWLLYNILLILTILSVVGGIGVMIRLSRQRARMIEGGDGTVAADVRATRPGTVKYHIKMAPGGLYMPGIIPVGSKEPLTGFTRAAAEFEAMFPDTKIEFVNVPASSREYQITQLASRSAPDIIAINVEDAWLDADKGWYVQLDPFLEQPNPFLEGNRQWWDVFKYQAITRGKADPNGRSFAICFDVVETGIFYNKDIFNELGIAPPDTWSEFLEIQRKIDQAGYIPLLMSMDVVNDWAVDIFFDQMYRSVIDDINLSSGSDRSAHIDAYLDAGEISFLHTKGFFTAKDPRYREVWRLLKQWRPYWNKSLAFSTSTAAVDVSREFIKGRGAMMWDSCMFVQILKNEKAVDFDWDVFYLPPMEESNSPFATGDEFCVIGGGGTMYEVTSTAFSDTLEIETSKRLKRVVQFLQFITTPLVNDMIVNEPKRLISNINGVEVMPGFERFEEILTRRYACSKWIFTFGLKFADMQGRMLQMYLDGWIDEDELLEWFESNVALNTKAYVEKNPMDFAPFEKEWQRRGLVPVRDAAALPGKAR